MTESDAGLWGDRLHAFSEVQTSVQALLSFWTANKALSVSRSNRYQAVFPILLYPMAENLRSMLKLGASVDGAIVFRSLLERAVHLSWVSMDRYERAERYMAEHWMEAYLNRVTYRSPEQPALSPEIRDHLDGQLCLYQGWLLTEVGQERLAERKRLRRKDFKEINLWDRLEQTQASHLYPIYRALCSWTHPSHWGFGALTEHRGPHEKLFKPFHPDRAINNLLLASRLFWGALVQAASAFGKDWGAQLTSWISEWETLHNLHWKGGGNKSLLA